MLKTLANMFGVVFVAVGVLGFVPGITTDGHLLGIFEVDALHNIVHLASGAAALYAASAGPKAAKMYFKLFGVIYALVTVVGFGQGDTVLGLIPVNTADNFLHLAIAAAALAIGFGVPAEEAEEKEEN